MFITLQRLHNNDDEDSDVEDGDVTVTTTSEDLFALSECQVCFNVVRLNRQPCCQLPICQDCLQMYLNEMNLAGALRVSCPNPACDRPMIPDQIRQCLTSSDGLRDRYERWLVDVNAEPYRKTCPRCCHITQIEPSRLKGHWTAKHGLLVDCSECQFQWCFPCQAPWHEGRTCKMYRKEDRAHLKNWARQLAVSARHEYNAQRCPKCKVLVWHFVSVLCCLQTASSGHMLPHDRTSLNSGQETACGFKYRMIGQLRGPITPKRN